MKLTYNNSSEISNQYQCSKEGVPRLGRQKASSRYFLDLSDTRLLEWSISKLCTYEHQLRGQNDHPHQRITNCDDIFIRSEDDIYTRTECKNFLVPPQRANRTVSKWTSVQGLLSPAVSVTMVSVSFLSLTFHLCRCTYKVRKSCGACHASLWYRQVTDCYQYWHIDDQHRSGSTYIWCRGTFCFGRPNTIKIFCYRLNSYGSAAGRSEKDYTYL